MAAAKGSRRPVFAAPRTRKNKGFRRLPPKSGACYTSAASQEGFAYGQIVAALRGKSRKLNR